MHMNLVKRWKNDLWDPMDGFERLRDDINRLFDLRSYPESRGLFDRTFSPAVDISETAESVVVECNLPGVTKEDLDVLVAGDILTIRGAKRGEKETKDKKVYTKESWEGSFQRTLSLPIAVDAAKIEATLKDGVLKIVLPKKEEAKAKRIAIADK